MISRRYNMFNSRKHNWSLFPPAGLLCSILPFDCLGHCIFPYCKPMIIIGMENRIFHFGAAHLPVSVNRSGLCLVVLSGQCEQNRKCAHCSRSSDAPSDKHAVDCRQGYTSASKMESGKRSHIKTHNRKKKRPSDGDDPPQSPPSPSRTPQRTSSAVHTHAHTHAHTHRAQEEIQKSLGGQVGLHCESTEL